MEFSQFKTLVNLVEQKATDFKAEIIEANKQKLISLACQFAKDMGNVLNAQKDYLRDLESNLRVLEREICNNSMETASRNITSKTQNAIDSAYGNLKSNIFGLIDKEPSDIKQKADDYQRLMLQELEENIRTILNSELKKVRETANRKIKNLDGVNIQPISFRSSVNLQIEIDFTGALEELDIDISDVLGWAAKTAGTAMVGAALGAALGSFIPVAGNVLGAVAGGVVGGVAHAFSGDGGKADARKSVSDALATAKQRVKKNITSILAPVIRNISEQQQQLRGAVKAELANIEDLQDSLDGFDDEINDFVNGIKHKRYGRI